MGVILEALAAPLAAIAALAVGAGLTMLLERAVLPIAGPGPAAPAHWRTRTAPPNADRWLLPAGPVTALAGVVLATAVLPLDDGWIVSGLDIGIFYFIVVVDFVVLGVALAGWGANTPYSVEACYRVVAQLVAYVIPLGLALVGVIMMAESMSTAAIVEAQRDGWFALYQPQGLALYLVCGLMQVYRAPFLEPFSETIGHGVLGVTGTWQAVAWRLALSGVLFVVAALGAVLFLGGWLGPVLPGALWMGLKTFALMALMLLIARLVRPRGTAWMLALVWKVLIPLGLVNVLIVGAFILMGVRPQ